MKETRMNWKGSAIHSDISHQCTYLTLVSPLDPLWITGHQFYLEENISNEIDLISPLQNRFMKLLPYHGTKDQRRPTFRIVLGSVWCVCVRHSFVPLCPVSSFLAGQHTGLYSDPPWSGNTSAVQAISNLFSIFSTSKKLCVKLFYGCFVFQHFSTR